GGEGGVEPGLLLHGEVLVAGEQQLPAGPDFVGGGAAAAVQLPVSSSCRLAQTLSVAVPRRPCSCRVIR
ncbi:hypothetical protein J6397_33605, partial [Rhodococcus qingshengii]|uniref:hypothetical protein n=1 Tax=Rhodococcus qingshengii TaxID=334542 RepID=UPI001AE3E25E|nr:hypothetical protein [Rhodococcus qingshengii]